MTRLFKKSAIVATLLAAGIGAAHAEGLYVGGNLGTPDYKSSINGVDGRGSGLGAKLFGGYELSPNFAVEAGIFDLGHIDDDSGKIKLHGAYLDGVGRYELAPHWALIGRAGLAEGRFTGSTGDDSSPAFKLGAGLQYDLSRTVAVRAEYEHYHFSNAFDAKPSVGEYSIGLKVGF
jgi:OmpA-OmpF porin, OOP family